MNKKAYFSPEMEELEIESFALLAGSGDGTQESEGEGTGGESSGEDY
jgi:hypothetical protein